MEEMTNNMLLRWFSNFFVFSADECIHAPIDGTLTGPCANGTECDVSCNTHYIFSELANEDQKKCKQGYISKCEPGKYQFVANNYNTFEFVAKSQQPPAEIATTFRNYNTFCYVVYLLDPTHPISVESKAIYSKFAMFYNNFCNLATCKQIQSDTTKGKVLAACAGTRIPDVTKDRTAATVDTYDQKCCKAGPNYKTFCSCRDRLNLRLIC